MKIGINASFVRKPSVGIGQVTLNVLRTLSNFKFQISNFNSNSNEQIFNFKSNNEKLEFVLYLEKDLPEDINFNLGDNFIKRFFLPFWKRDDLIRKIWWEKCLLPKKVKEDRCESFISLYQCPTILPKKIKHTMVVHDIIPKLFPEYLNNFRKKFYWKLTEKAIKKADKIIAISKHTKKDLIKYLDISEEKIMVRYIDVDDIYKKEISDEESKRVLDKYDLKRGYIYSGGGLEKRKNIETLLKAYKLLIKNSKFLPLRQAGKIPNLVISGKLMPELSPIITDVESLVKELKLKDKVKLLDFIPQEDLPALYENASIFVYPSLYEGFGLPILEAMNCGTSVICSNVSSLLEVGGEAVVYFDPKDKKELAEKIKEILNNEELRQDLSERGKKQANNFSWDKFVK